MDMFHGFNSSRVRIPGARCLVLEAPHSCQLPECCLARRLNDILFSSWLFERNLVGWYEVNPDFIRCHLDEDGHIACVFLMLPSDSSFSLWQVQLRVPVWDCLLASLIMGDLLRR